MLAMSMSAWANPVSQQAALATAQNFLSDDGSGITPQPTSINLIRLIHTELCSHNSSQVAYYIFSTGSGYVIVAGDDRADAILAYGDGDFDLNNIPCGAQFMLALYKQEMDFLFSNPNLDVMGGNTPQRVAPLASYGSVAPLLTTLWGQDAPYYNECPMYFTLRCITGCACTSLSMVMNYWKYPVAEVGPIPGYKTLSISINLDELPPTTFDWENMLDSYTGDYTQEQADAVAHLMRYVGQSEEMDYTPENSGAGVEGMLTTLNRFGYDENATVVTKEMWLGSQMYTDAAWCSMLLNELNAGRPVVYIGYHKADDGSYMGHAFNVDGYDAVQKLFHVNFGWNGDGNGYYSFNSFGTTEEVFNIYQQMLIGIQPPTDPVPDPMITVDPEAVTFDGVAVNDVVTRTFVVTGTDLKGNLKLKLNDDTGDFAIDKTSITAEAAQEGAVVTVTYNPIEACTSNATVTISGGGAAPMTVSLTGTAIVPDPEIIADVTTLNFGSVYNGYGKNMTFTLRGVGLTENISLSISRYTNEIFVYPSTITPADAAQGVTVTVRCFPTSAGRVHSSLVLSSAGAENVTIPIDANFIKTSAFINVDQDSLAMSANVNTKVSKTLQVTYRRFNGWLATPHITLDPIDLIPKDSLISMMLCPFSAIISGDEDFSVASSRLVSTDGVVDTCLVTVNYCPATVGSHTAQLTLVSDVAYPVIVPLFGISTTIAGDMDGNGVLGINDVVVLIQSIMSGENFVPSGADCDINGDGVINVDDILTLLYMLSVQK